MKRKNLTTAIVAGLAGIAGLSSISYANVHVNDDGVGNVLIYPYYTTQQKTIDDVDFDLNTLISVVNTSNDVVAVKVRFLEGKNTREVLDFNLYLSPYDVWTTALTPSAGGGGTTLTTYDRSCTVPDIYGRPGHSVDFRPFAYDGTVGSYDGLGRDLARVREGHFEIIEMGVVGGAKGAAATHVAGIPASCTTLTNAWNTGGAWTLNNNDEMTAPTGAIFGATSIVNVNNASAVSYSATALSAFWGDANPHHTAPGTLFPSLNSGTNESLVFDNGMVWDTFWPRGAEAVSALFMRDHVYQEYSVTGPTGFQSETSYVITFPTKRFYVDNVFTNPETAPVKPFTTSIPSSGNGACEPMELGYYDREEQYKIIDILDFSPHPIDITTPVLCWESNVVNINTEAVLSDTLYSANAYDLKLDYSTGWVNFAFPTQSTMRGDSTIPVGSLTNTGDTTYNGLPMLGFSVLQYVNASSTRTENVFKHYGSLFSHAYNRNITS